jgi:hypothetical protein
MEMKRGTMEEVEVELATRNSASSMATNPARAISSVIKKILLFLIIVLVVSLAINAISYINFNSNYGFLKLKEKAIATGWYLPFYYLHVLIAGLILLIGFFQLYFAAKKSMRTLHKALGYCYVFGILFSAAPGGFVMSLFINRGPWVLMSFLLQSVLWFGITAVAFNRILNKDIVAHKQWMWRSYALTFAAVTLRVYIFIFSWSFDMTQPAAYATFAWMSWVPNLMIVELLIRKQVYFRSKSFGAQMHN